MNGGVSKIGRSIKRVDSEGTEQAISFQVDRVAGRIGVNRNFCDKVRSDVRSGKGIGRRGRAIQAQACIDLSIGKCDWRCWEGYRTPGILLGIFDSETESYFIVGVKDETELGRSLPSQAHIIVRIHVLGIEDVRRHDSYASPAGCDHAPVLPAEKFPFAAAIVDKIEARAQGVGIAGDVQIVVGETQKAARGEGHCCTG